MNITITGNLGSGKTSICSELKEMGYEIISVGSIFREIAEEKGVSVIELNEMAKKDRAIDDLLDERSTHLGKIKDNVIFDSRLAWNFVPDSFKVFVIVDIDEAANRVFKGENRNAEDYQSKEDAKDGLCKRADLERQRFSDLYNIDYYNGKNYNLIIESTNATPKQLAEEIIRNFQLYKEQPFIGKVQLNVTSLYPVKPLEEENFNETDKKVIATIKDGYTYAIGNYGSVILGAKNKEVFTEVAIDLSEEAMGKVNILKKAQLEKYQQECGFKYAKYPDMDKDATGYVFDFSDIAE